MVPAFGKGLPFDQEPEIEPEPGAWSRGSDQRDQNVNGSQTNITGNVCGHVISGEFKDPVAIGENSKAIVNYKLTIPREKLPVPTIRSPPKDFTGRKKELEEILKAFGHGATITGLWVAGGIGKTTLAL